MTAIHGYLSIQVQHGFQILHRYSFNQRRDCCPDAALDRRASQRPVNAPRRVVRNFISTCTWGRMGPDQSPRWGVFAVGGQIKATPSCWATCCGWRIYGVYTGDITIENNASWVWVVHLHQLLIWAKEPSYIQETGFLLLSWLDEHGGHLSGLHPSAKIKIVMNKCPALQDWV